MKIIGLAGYSNTGKTLAAEIIRNLTRDKYQVVRFSFAGTLKRELAELFECTFDLIEQKKRTEPLMRRILQFVGDQVRDKSFDKFNELIMNLNRDEVKNPLVLIDDIRLTREAQLVLDHGGYVFLVDRPTAIQFNNHITETDIAKIPFSVRIINDKESEKVLVTELQHFLNQLEII